jgi:hypothetical protein
MRSGPVETCSAGSGGAEFAGGIFMNDSNVHSLRDRRNAKSVAERQNAIRDIEERAAASGRTLREIYHASSLSLSPMNRRLIEQWIDYVEKRGR